jgi:hypothetical protein
MSAKTLHIEQLDDAQPQAVSLSRLSIVIPSRPKLCRRGEDGEESEFLFGRAGNTQQA